MANKTVSATEYAKLVDRSGRGWFTKTYKKQGLAGLPGVESVQLLSAQYVITLIDGFSFNPPPPIPIPSGRRKYKARVK